MRYFQSLIVCVVLFSFLPSCKEDSTSTPITQNQNKKIYYNQQYSDMDDNSPKSYSVWEYDLESKVKTKILDTGFVCSNFLNNEFAFIDSGNRLNLYNIDSKTRIKLLDETNSSISEVFLSSTGKMAYFEASSNEQNSKAIRNLYIGTKANIKEKLVSSNMDKECVPELYFNTTKIAYGVSDAIGSNDTLIIVDIASAKIEYTTANVGVSHDWHQSFSGSKTTNLVTAMSFYASDETKSGKIVFINPLTNEVKNLPNSSTPKACPIFSPDGTKIAFYEVNPETKKVEISYCNVDGTSQVSVKDITDAERYPFTLKWLDANHILYSMVKEHDGNKNITNIIDIRTGDITPFDNYSFFLPWM